MKLNNDNLLEGIVKVSAERIIPINETSNEFTVIDEIDASLIGQSTAFVFLPSQ